MPVASPLRLAPIVVAVLAPVLAVAAPVPIVNADFESTKAGASGLDGWSTYQHTGPESYDFALDSGEKKDGTQSLRIANIGPEPFGALKQTISAAGLTGKKLKLSAWVKTSAIPDAGKRGGAALTLTALRGSAVVATETMRKRELRGTTDWTRHSIELSIPPNAVTIDFGATLLGPGKMWVDGFALETVEP
ncbi:MAG: hypothetical protein U1F51_14885 [Burkholderiales bacterium]